MSQRISLNGNDWLFKDFYGEDWLWRNAHHLSTRDVLGWQHGSVPGSVLHDVWQAGRIPDPYYERNSLLSEWVPARTWLYKKSFSVAENLRSRRIRLCFRGVDYTARFFLNGESLGEHQGMYTPVNFEIAGLLHYGEGATNLLAVVIEPAPFEQPQVGYTSHVRTHKARMNYWWDFCPRMLHQGIWDDVSLQITGPVRIEDVFVQPQLSADLKAAELVVSAELSSISRADVEIETAILFEGREIACENTRQALVAGGASRLESRFEIQAPHLWWPNGYGAQPLYQARVRVLHPGGVEETPETRDRAEQTTSGSQIGTFSFPSDEVRLAHPPAAAAPELASPVTPSARPAVSPAGAVESDACEVTFGCRRIELLPNATPDRSAPPYIFCVNGQRIYAKGWNWVPIDALYGVERPAKLEHLLELARRAHVNLLRVWGGGLIEKEAFYDLCDRHGILIWQEFILSSSGIDNCPSDDPAYVAMLAHEAEAIVPLKRNHPSLVVWCGGNELQDGPDRPLETERAPALTALHGAVARLDPTRHWLPTSPRGRFFGNSLENVAKDPLGLHDVHGPWEHQGLTKQYTLFNETTSLFHSEFGVEGLANLRTLERTISLQGRWPVARANPAWFHSAAWWLREQTLVDAFGTLPNLISIVRASQFLQFEGLRYALEANRRRKYRNSGSLPWQFNEPFPNAACTSAVDYFGRPKPVYYGVAASYRALHVSARFETQAWAGRDVFRAEIWISNSRPQDLEPVTLTAQVVGADGQTYVSHAQSVSAPANSATLTLEIRCPLVGMAGDLFFLDLQLADSRGMPLDLNRYLFTRTDILFPLFDAPLAAPTSAMETSGDSWRLDLHNPGPYASLNLWLEDARPIDATGYVYFSDNYFCLLPGETRAVSAEWIDVPPAERQVGLQGWNTHPIVLSL